MHQLPGVSASGNKPGSTGSTFGEKTWSTNSSVCKIGYGAGYFFGGRGTSLGYYVYASPSSGTVTATGSNGVSNSNQQPSYENGYFVFPGASGAFVYATSINGTWTSKTPVTSSDQVNRILYVSQTGEYLAIINGLHPYVSTTISGTYSVRTYSGGNAGYNVAETDGNRIIFGGNAGQLRYADGTSTTATTITHPFGATASFRTIKYWPSQGVWTAGTAAGTMGYSETSNGSSGWTLVTPNFSTAGGFTAGTDGDLLFMNNRWYAIASNSGGTQVSVSVSATSSVSSAFSSIGSHALTGGANLNSAGTYATNGNWIAGILGVDLFYMR
jgi:hypothetical protein